MTWQRRMRILWMLAAILVVVMGAKVENKGEQFLIVLLALFAWLMSLRR